MLIEPEEISIRMTLVQIERSLGNLKGVERELEDALKNAKTTEDSSAVVDGLTQHHVFTGRGKKAIELYEQGLVLKQEFMPPVNLLFLETFASVIYAFGGQAERAFARLKEIESLPTMIPQLKPIISAGYLTTYFTTEDIRYIDDAKHHLGVFESWVTTTNTEQFRWAVDWSRAGILHWEDEREAALESALKALETIGQGQEQRPTLIQLNAYVGELMRELGRYEQGRVYVEQALVMEPYDPKANHEMALLYHEMGDQDKAATHLGRALYVYEEADVEHPIVRQVQATRTEWESKGLRVQ
jgi:tetratricopeptide (TPR) repeat protein